MLFLSLFKLSVPFVLFNLFLDATTKRETGRKAQLLNIRVGKDVADVLRTCLGPRAMLKMILSAGGFILMTNDGNSIIREIDITHPAARTIIQLSRAQDENVGDGTTSVIVLGTSLSFSCLFSFQSSLYQLVKFSMLAQAF